MLALLSFLAGFLVLWLLIEIYIQIQLFQLLRDCLKELKELEDDVCCKRYISNASNTTDSQLICGTNEMADERKVTNGRVDLYSSRRLLHS
ncbi:hypothetical protein D1641_18190 [Colidextribacter sp. OB.20]|nr:hypothetical protein [Colidextribacter sp. OB.20]